MKDLLLHESTSARLSSFLQTPSHALLIVGQSGSGKMHLAQRLAEELLGLETGHIQDHPHVSIIKVEDDKKLIAIEAVRKLEQFLALKVPGGAEIKRVAIVEDAHLLSIEAQNALLKTLEEPPADTVLILTARHEQALLPTIRSRVASIPAGRPGKLAIKDYFSQRNYAERDIHQAYSISGGLPGLMAAMLDEEDHPLSRATETARQLLSQTAYERLLLVDALSKDKQLAADTLFILQQMAHVSLQSASGKGAERWQAVMEAAYKASEALQHNAQPKLVLTSLMLSL